MRYFIIAAVAVMLTGCVSPAEQYRVSQDPWAFNPFGLFKKQATWEDIDDGKCRSYGAEPGTPVYIQCRASLGVASQMQQQQQQNSQPTYQAQPQWITPPPQNTWCRRVGQQVSCTTQ